MLGKRKLKEVDFTNEEDLEKKQTQEKDLKTSSEESASDDSEDEYVEARIGDIPLDWYKDEKHIGYNIEGKKVAKKVSGGKKFGSKLKGDKLDSIINKEENPNWFRTIRDELNQRDVVITDKQLEMIRKLRTGQYLSKKMRESDYSYTLDKKDFIHPFDSSQPAKRSFIPSKWERMKVNKIIHAINMGWMNVDDEEDKEEEEEILYDLWGEDQSDPRTAGKLPPPLILPKSVKPEHDESYNPPVEYLPSEQEAKEWKESHPEDKEKNYLPRKYKHLRHVEVYTDLIKERFERCLDLYLAPRVKKRKVHMNPDAILPDLPPPSTLKPFPSFANIYYEGHKNRVRAIKTDDTGKYLLSGDESGLLLIFHVNTSRILKRFKFKGTIYSVDWSHNGLIVCAEGTNLHVINPGFGGSKEKHDRAKELIENAKRANGIESNHIFQWKFYAEKNEENEEENELFKNGLRITIPHQNRLNQVTFHARGDYFASVCPKAKNNIQVLIHSFNKGKSQRPFAKSKSNIQKVLFHHSKPILFIATQQHIWVFNLKSQKIVKKLISGVKWYSCLDLHPGGDNLITGSYDRRLNWYDLDLSEKPYQTLRFHKKAIRQTRFHHSYPLFASCSDDGHVNVFHGMVYNDLMKNALIVPVKILKGHKIVDQLGVLDICWHPKQPWIFSAGADHKIILWS